MKVDLNNLFEKHSVQTTSPLVDKQVVAKEYEVEPIDSIEELPKRR